MIGFLIDRGLHLIPYAILPLKVSLLDFLPHDSELHYQRQFPIYYILQFQFEILPHYSKNIYSLTINVSILYVCINY